MVVKCELHFVDNPMGIYYAGQTVKGRVELHMDKPKKVRGMALPPALPSSPLKLFSR